MDNHIQDAVYTFHHPYLLPYYAYVLRKPGLSGNLNLTVIEGATQTNVVAPITNRSTDVFDNPLPFAWYDGELLMVFNLHMGIATGGTPYSYWLDNILRITVDGTLVPLTDHRVGGRAYWYAGKGWKLERIEPPGLFVPGQHSYIICYYEKRPPFPTVKLGSDVLNTARFGPGRTRCCVYAVPIAVVSPPEALTFIRSGASYPDTTCSV
jgi:hypothetical protein